MHKSFMSKEDKMFGTYKPQDVEVLLKVITGMVTPLPTKERERRIQSGVHYSRCSPLNMNPRRPILPPMRMFCGGMHP
ncbi:MAG: cysteine protease StiP domain-containing protein [Dysosmobacter sp.]